MLTPYQSQYVAWELTQYRNFQNAVQAQDFSALDEGQYRLKATLALACRVTGSGWNELVAAAVADPQRLFSREPGSPDGKGGVHPSISRRIFPDSLSATELWRAVQVARQVLASVPNISTDPNHQPILQNGVWLCLHVAFLRRRLHQGEEFSLRPDEQSALSRWAELIGEALIQTVEANTWTKGIPDLFADPTDCDYLRSKMLAALPMTI